MRGQRPSFEERRRTGLHHRLCATQLGLVLEDLRVSGNRVGSAAFHALVMYRFGVWRDALPPGLLRKLLRPLYVLLHWHVRHRSKIELHYTASVGRRVSLSDAGHITIGNDASIGDDCRIGPGVTLGRTELGWPTIGRGVVLAPGAVVVGAVHVGDEAVIGPNAVVLSDVPPRATIGLRSFLSAREIRAQAPSSATDASLRTLRSRDVPMTVEVRSGSKISSSGYIAFYGPVRLGAKCRIHEGVTIGWPQQDESAARLTRIGAHVELGPGVVVMAGVHIDDYVHVEPNVVVSEDVPAGMLLRAVSAQSFGRLDAG